MKTKSLLILIIFLLGINKITGQELILSISPDTVNMSKDEYANYKIELKNVAQKDLIIYSFYLANILDTNYVPEFQHMGLYIALMDSAGHLLTPNYVTLRKDSNLLPQYHNPYHIYTLLDEVRTYGDIKDGKSFYKRQVMSTRRELPPKYSLIYDLKDDLYSYSLSKGRYKIFALFGVPDFIKDIIGEETYNKDQGHLYLGHVKSNEIILIVP